MFTQAAAALFTLALVSSSAASPLQSRADQLNCTIAETKAPNLLITPTNGGQGGSTPGFSSNYLLQDALTAAKTSFDAQDNPEVLERNAAMFQQFSFFACASSYMGYPASLTDSNGVQKWYGLLSPQGFTPHTTNPSNCTTLRSYPDSVNPTVEFFVNEPCSFNDDQSQVNQYFELVFVTENDAQEIVQYNLTYLGHPKDTTGPDFYLTPGTADAPAVTVQRDQDTGYRASLQYLHEN